MVIGLNKFAYIYYSFCWRFMNNSVGASSEQTGKGTCGFATHVHFFSGVIFQVACVLTRRSKFVIIYVFSWQYQAYLRASEAVCTFHFANLIFVFSGKVGSVGSVNPRTGRPRSKSLALISEFNPELSWMNCTPYMTPMLVLGENGTFVFPT